MNRGHGGNAIFSENTYKKAFLKLLSEQAKKHKIKLLVYSIMDTHYHLILQNSSGKLSDFMKQLNGTYGSLYRKCKGGKGYVFQGRYKSLLVQEGSYLTMVSTYVLLNCVAAGIVADPFEYQWSSISEYFSGEKSGIVDNTFMEEIFGSKAQMEQLLREWSFGKLPIEKTRFGNIMGGKHYIEDAKKLFDRRRKKEQSNQMRIDDQCVRTPENIIREFQRTQGMKIDDIDTNSFEGKRLRATLLVLLKDEAGLSYREIVKYPIFMSLKHSSLGQIYRRAKKRMIGEP